MHCAKASIAELFVGVEMARGFFKFLIGEEVNAQVGTSILSFFHGRGIRENAPLHVWQDVRPFTTELAPSVADAKNK